MPASDAFALYQRHLIINVNLNVMGSGLLAIAIAKGPVWLVSHWIGTEKDVLIVLIAGAIDGAIDIGLYFAFHWFANQYKTPRAKRFSLALKKRRQRLAEARVSEKARKEAESEAKAPRFWRDASIIQFQRIALTPLFYVISFGGMFGLMQLGMSESWAFVFAFSAAVLCTRIVHTVIGLKIGTFEIPPWSEFTSLFKKTQRHTPSAGR